MNKSKIFVSISIVLTWFAILLSWFIIKDKFEFQNPWFFALLGIIPLLGIHYFFSNRSQPFVQNSNVSNFDSLPTSPLVPLRHILHVLFMFGITALVFVLARPQSKTETQEVNKEGIDIVVAMDVSGSMLATDFKPNRLESSKKVAKKFVEGRNDDRFGLVVYEGEAYTLVPLTADHRVVINSLSEIETGLVEGGTAVGMGLAAAVNRLKDSEAKSKVIILLTDGVNNSGAINPIDAARIAQTFDIRVYTIGVGSNGMARTPVGIRNGQYVFDRVKVEIDEKTLKEIAKKTNGKYFRADSEKKLKSIYKEIDELEKTKFNITQYSQHKEEFLVFGYFSLAFFLIGFMLKNTIFRGV